MISHENINTHSIPLLTTIGSPRNSSIVRSSGDDLASIFDHSKANSKLTRSAKQEYYSSHGADALLIAAQVYRTQTVLKYLGKPTKSDPLGLPSCTLSLATAQSFLRDALTTKQLRIEIYEIDGKGSSAVNKWKLSKSASPGNLGAVEELLFAKADLFEAPVIMALQLSIKDGIKTVGIAFADTSMQEMGVSQFIDNDLFSNTEVGSLRCGF